MAGAYIPLLLVLSNCLNLECVESVNPRAAELGLLDYSLPVPTLSAETVLSNLLYSATDNAVFVNAGQTIVKLADGFTSHVTFSRPKVVLNGVVRRRMFAGVPDGRFLDCTTTNQALVCRLETLANGAIRTLRETDIALNGDGIALAAVLSDNPRDDQRLYIARAVGDNRHKPKIEVRKLNDLSQIRARVPLIHGISRIDNSRYEFGFSTSTFMYFVRTSGDVSEGSRHTFLERFCISGNNISENQSIFNSYSRLPLTCNVGRVSFRYFRAGHLGYIDGHDVLVGVFSDSPSGSDVSRPRSAMCVFGISDIDDAFRRNIQKCFKDKELHDIFLGNGTALQYEDVRCSSCHPSVSAILFTLFSDSCKPCNY